MGDALGGDYRFLARERIANRSGAEYVNCVSGLLCSTEFIIQCPRHRLDMGSKRIASFQQNQFVLTQSIFFPHPTKYCPKNQPTKVSVSHPHPCFIRGKRASSNTRSLKAQRNCFRVLSAHSAARSSIAPTDPSPKISHGGAKARRKGLYFPAGYQSKPDSAEVPTVSDMTHHSFTQSHATGHPYPAGDPNVD